MGCGSCLPRLAVFILVANILSIKLRSDRNAKGIELGDAEDKICQFADDTTTVVKNLKSLECAISHFQNFQECSDLKLILEKSEIIPLGPYRKQQMELPNAVSQIFGSYGTFKDIRYLSFSKQ